MIDRIVYQNSELYYYREGDGNKYYREGDGNKVILLFHGFGQDHKAFDSWIEPLENDYTIFTFDLFFHGNSKWNQQTLTKENWKKIIELFLNQEKIDQFEVAGFSMGSKFVLATVGLFPERVSRIILIAPDGIKNNFWYSLATGTSLMRSLFRSIILKPKRLNALTRFIKLFQLEDKNLLRFVEFQLSTEEKRKRVYNSWIYFRLLNFNLSDLALVLNSRNIPVVFILGKSDKVIPAGRVKSFAKTLTNKQFHWLDAGHHDLISRGVNYI
jgi:pimeloyl-ACP methyl ester carboxylesterase